MLGRVMHGKVRPEPSARFLAESVHQCFAEVGAQVVQNQMDGGWPTSQLSFTRLGGPGLDFEQ